MVKFYKHYALDEEGKLVQARDVDKQLRHLHTYKCLSCGERMIVRQGEKRKWHFAHKNTVNCDNESYLHCLAKRMICDWYNRQSEIPIYIMTPTKCVNYDSCKWTQKGNCTGMVKNKYNLKSRFYRCENEDEAKEKVFEKDGKRYIADIFCHNNRDEADPLFIEVYVTHKCDDEKRNSGIKIIEVKIESEEDIENFINNPIEESNKVKYYGIHPYIAKGSNDFEIPLQRFILYKSGKIYVLINGFTCKDYHERRGIFEVTLDNKLLFQSGYIELEFVYFIGVVLAYNRNHNLKFCRLCKWLGYNRKENKYICKLSKNETYGTKRYCYENDAYKCDYYSFEDKIYKFFSALIKKIEENGTIDIWSSNDG